MQGQKAIGWALSSRMFANETVVIPALKMATLNKPVVDDLIFHSDTGVQYALGRDLMQDGTMTAF